MDYAHTVWRSDWLCRHSLEIRWTVHTVWRSDGLCTHSLEITWTMHKHPGEQMDYVHSLEIPWTMRTQPGNLMNCVYTNWRSDKLCIYTVEIGWTVYRQTGDQLVASTSGSCRWHNYSVLARCVMHTGKLVINKLNINWSSTIRRPHQSTKGGFRKLASLANRLFWKTESIFFLRKSSSASPVAGGLPPGQLINF
jgi:hypothetical protein